MYNLSLSKIKKIANPFEQISYDYLESPIKKEEIEKILNNEKLSILPNDTLRLKLIKKIVEKIINYQDEVVHIDFNNMINIKSGWCVSNVEYLAAAIYISETHKKDLIIKITGEEKILYNLFQLKKEEEKLNLNNHQYKNNFFDWKERNFFEVNDWEDPVWILRQDNKLIIENTPEKFWQDSDFVKSYITLIEEEIISSKNLILKKLLMTLNSKIYEYPLVKKELFNIPFKKDLGITFPYLWEIKSNTEKIKNELASKINKEVLYYLLFQRKLEVIKFTKTKIKKEVKLDPENIKMFYICLEKTDKFDKNKINIEKYLPEEFYENKENIYEFMSKVVEINPSYQMYYYNYIFKYWKENEERIKELLSSENIIQYKVPKSLKYFYTILSVENQENETIIKKFIQKTDGNIISEIPVKLRKNIELLECACIKGYKINLTDVNIFFDMKNEKAQINFIKHNPNVINNKNLPNEWLKNRNIVKASFSKIKWQILPEEMKEKILTDKQFAVEIVNINRDIYSNLPIYLKIDKDIIVSFLKGHQITKENKEFETHLDPTIEILIPKCVYYSREILIEIIKLDSAKTHSIPKEFYKEKKFIIDLLSIYDENKEKNHFDLMILKLPEEIKTFFNENKINNNYVEKLEEIFLHNDLEYHLNNSKIKNIIKSKRKI